VWYAATIREKPWGEDQAQRDNQCVWDFHFGFYLSVFVC
jgi:hypothetical protein